MGGGYWAGEEGVSAPRRGRERVKILIRYSDALNSALRFFQEEEGRRTVECVFFRVQQEDLEHSVNKRAETQYARGFVSMEETAFQGGNRRMAPLAAFL